MEQPVFEFLNVGKQFNQHSVLQSISFQLFPGRVTGVVGENGAGKSTLMNIMGGVHKPNEGSMTLYGHPYSPAHPSEADLVGIAFIHQELNLFTNLSIAENFFITQFPNRGVPFPWIDQTTMRRLAEEWLQHVDLPVPPSTLIEYLPPAERQLVEIAKAIGKNTKILLLDEPTTSLTAHESQRLFELINQLKSKRIAMIYISHNLNEVLNLCDEIIVLRDGRITGKGKRDEFTKDSMVSLMVGQDMNQYFPVRENHKQDEIILETKGLSQSGVIHDIHLKMYKGEVLGLFGLIGSGRTELARILFGLDPYEKGELYIHGKPLKPSPKECIHHGMAFLTENRQEEGLLLQAPVHTNIAQVELPNFITSGFKWIKQSLLNQHVNQIIAETNIRCSSPRNQIVKTLSGGNQQKVVFGKWYLSHPEIFIVDEPARGIDIGAKHEIYLLVNRLVEQGTGVLYISSEIEELLGMCDRILVMNKGEIKGEVYKEHFDREHIMHLALGGTLQ